MTQINSDNLGVYYASKDYAGLLKRSIAWLVDIAVLCTFLSILGFTLSYIYPEDIIVLKISFWFALFFSYFYLSILKPSRYRTLGYIATGIKIVDLYGKKPSWNTMLTRFMLLGFSPLAFIIDILWLTGEHTRQTLRDKYVGTYVVNNMSSPAGNANLNKVVLNFMGWNLIYKEIEQ